MQELQPRGSDSVCLSGCIDVLTVITREGARTQRGLRVRDVADTSIGGSTELVPKW